MLINIDEYVSRTGLKKETLLKLLRKGKAPGRKIGGEWLVLENDIGPWLENLMQSK